MKDVNGASKLLMRPANDVMPSAWLLHVITQYAR